VVLAGLVAPFMLDLVRRGRNLQRHHLMRATLVLVGGLILRFVIVMAPQWPEVKPWHL
jgi:formate-dependent nitrite reductase membrane component NrfD